MRCLLLLLVLLAAPAGAQERPPLLPSRDVQVTYKTVGRNAGHVLTFSQAAGAPRLRIDGDALQGYAIVDLARHTTSVVMTAQKMVLELSADRPPGEQFTLPDAQSRFTRRGHETIAGVDCTVWDYDTGKATGAACITGDGALLRTLSRDGDGLVATAVSYAPQPAAKFQTPAGYQRMTYPAGYAGAAPAGAAGAAKPAAGAAAGGVAAGAAAGAPPPPANLPAGVSVPPGFQLPPGISLPPGLKIPPGFKLPPGVQLPPGFALPPSP